MIIERTLQHVKWKFDSIKNEFILTAPIADPFKGQTVIKLTKTEAFSLNRFFIRAFQKMSQKPRVKKGW